MPVNWLEKDVLAFPDVSDALDEPNGLLAAGGDLSPSWLNLAYERGIFPWYEQGQPILWWCPDPRMVLYLDQLRVSRSMIKLLRRNPFQVSFDTSFSEVIRACAQSRAGAAGTWITDDMKDAYIRLHETGVAHSVEVWHGSQLVGGLYGVAKGKVFFGESMFSQRSNASKVAFIFLVKQLARWGYQLIDCQVSSEHLQSLGATEIPRTKFLELLDRLIDQSGQESKWKFDDDMHVSAAIN